MLNITAEKLPKGILEFKSHAVAALDEHGKTMDAKYEEGHDLDIVSTGSPNIVCHSVYAAYSVNELRWVADFVEPEAADLMAQVLNAALDSGKARNGGGYSVFLMLEAARRLGLIPNDLEYDTSWGIALTWYWEWFGSSFNDPEIDEWAAIVNFLRGTEKYYTEKTTTPPTPALTDDGKFLLAYTEKLSNARVNPFYGDEQTEKRLIELGVRDEFKYVDHITSHDTEAEAGLAYDKVLENESTYSASICRVIKSTDY
jgi:hypothetical protein